MRRDVHHRPHFHAFYQDDVGIVAVDRIELIGGGLRCAPGAGRPRVGRTAQAELLAAWDRLQAGRSPGKIEPLR